jgi:hypothetical protein
MKKIDSGTLQNINSSTLGFGSGMIGMRGDMIGGGAGGGFASDSTTHFRTYFFICLNCYQKIKNKSSLEKS